MKTPTKFIAWIEEIGPRELAHQLDIHESTICQWRRGRCWPRVEYIKKICKLSKGHLTYADVIDGLEVRP